MVRQDKTVRAPKAARDIFAEFKDDPAPEVRQRANYWSVAIGLQDVDHLSVSQFLIDTAKRNIRGEITQEEVARLIEEYHSMGGRRKGYCDKSNTPETPIYFFSKEAGERIVLEDATDWEQPARREASFDYFGRFKNVISLSQGENDGIFEKIFSVDNTPLDRDFTVFQGIVTGNNDAFIFETEAVAAQQGVERRLLHPLCHGRDVARYGVRNLERRILYLTSDYDIRKYPGAEKWLKKFRDALEHTRDNDNPWYTLHRPRVQTELDRKEKIFVQNTRNESLPIRIVAALDTVGAYTSQGINIVIPKGDANLRFLLGILNSRLINHLFRTKFLNLAIKADFLKQVRIPIATPAQQAPIVTLVDRILTAKKKDSNADTSALESEIDQLVYKLYGLTDDEIAIVEGRNETKQESQGETARRPAASSRRRRQSSTPDAPAPTDDEVLE